MQTMLFRKPFCMYEHSPHRFDVLLDDITVVPLVDPMLQGLCLLAHPLCAGLADLVGVGVQHELF